MEREARADERRKVIAELTSYEGAQAAGAALHSELAETNYEGCARCPRLGRTVVDALHTFLAPVEEGDMSNTRDADPDPQTAHIEEARA